MANSPAAWRAALALCALAAMPVPGAQAQIFPAKSVRFVVPFATGGASDIVGRVVGQKLGEMWGQTVVVDNRAGGSGMIGTELVARSAPDGYVLLVVEPTFAITPSLFAKVPFDVQKDFKPIAMIASTAFLVVAHPSFPPSSLQDLVAYAKAHPGEVNAGAGGRGTATHLAVELFNQRAGVKLVPVFYKSSVDTVTDLLGGRIQIAFAPVASALPHVQSGALKALAVTSAQRSELAPNVPTIAESGVPGYDAAMWTGLFAPAGTPQDIVDRLSAAATKAVGSEDMQSKIKKSGGDPRVMGGKDFEDYVTKDIAKWSETVKASGIEQTD